jgi:FG-GAP repeat
MDSRWLALTVLAVAAPAAAADPGELLPPVPIQAGGRPLDVEREGHAAPFVGDFDGDGVRDLLVGQYFEGRLRVYRNAGTNARPRFEGYTWFEAGGQAGRVPEG